VQGGGTCSYNGLSPKLGVCPTVANWHLKPITINGVTKAYKGEPPCDGDRDHIKTVDFRDLLQKEMKISDDEIGKKQSGFKANPD
jgi:penicillin-binding protein 1A